MRLAPPAPGELGRLGPYRILGVLGTGGMGKVYRAHDTRLDREVALKVLLPEVSADPKSKARFVRGARAQAKVEHDHIIPIHDVGEDEAGNVFLVMPLLRGQTLAAALKANPRPPVAELVRIGCEIAEGLAAAHAVGLIHRDIKPANVWLEGGKRRVKILDFGLARVSAEVADAGASLAELHLPGPGTELLTAVGAVTGTPAYMSPEQALGQQLDARSDVFSLGVVLYEMATGRKPFGGRNPYEVLTAVATGEPYRAGAIVRDLPPALDDLIHRMLAKDPAARPQSADAVAAELDALLRALVPGSHHNAPGLGAAGDEPNVWADLESVEATLPPDLDVPMADPVTLALTGQLPAPAPATTRVPAPQGGRLIWVGVAAAVLFACAAVGVVVWKTRAKPRETVEAPPEPPPPVQPRPKAVPRTYPDREAAKLVLAKKGTVTTDATVAAISREADLPVGPFKLTSVWMHPPTTLPLTDDDLEKLKGLDALTELNVHGPTLSDAGIAKLLEQPFAPKLTTLMLSAPALTDAGLAAVGKCPALTVLVLQNAPRITDAGFACLEKLPALRRFECATVPLVTGTGLKHLRSETVAILRFTSAGLTDAVAPHLAKCSQVLELDLSGTFTDETARAVANLATVQKLTLFAPPLTDAGLEAVCKLPALTDLSVKAAGTTDAGFAHVGGAPKLASFYFSGKLSDAGLEKLHALKTLTAAQLTYAEGITPAGVRALRAAVPACKVLTPLDQKCDRRAAEWVLARGGSVVVAPALVVKSASDLPTAFELVGATVPVPAPGTDFEPLRDADRLADTFTTLGPGFDDAALRAVAAFPFAAKLRALALNQSSVSDAGLAELKRMPGLTAVQVLGGGTTGTGLAVCKELPNLTAVLLPKTATGDAALEPLRGLKLARLDLSDTRVTNAGLDAVAAVPALTTLNLSGTAITDAGLEKLAGLKALTALDVRNTRATGPGARALFEALPDCTITWDNGTTPGAIGRLERARPVLEWVAAAGGRVTIETLGKPTVWKGTPGLALPLAGRLAKLSFDAADLNVPDVARDDRKARLEALATALKPLPAWVWTEKLEPTLALSGGLGSADGFAALAGVPGLRPVARVALASESAADFVPHFAKFPNLRAVAFDKTPLEVAQWEQLGALPNLREASVTGCGPLPGAGVRALRAAPIAKLRVSGTDLTDEVVAELCATPALRELRFDTKAPTAEQLKALFEALPECALSLNATPLKPKK